VEKVEHAEVETSVVDMSDNVVLRKLLMSCNICSEMLKVLSNAVLNALTGNAVSESSEEIKTQKKKKKKKHESEVETVNVSLC
jgi:hypothetical protein